MIWAWLRLSIRQFGLGGWFKTFALLASLQNRLQRLCQTDGNLYCIVFIEVFIIPGRKNGKTKSGKETKRQGFSAGIGKARLAQSTPRELSEHLYFMAK